MGQSQGLNDTLEQFRGACGESWIVPRCRRPTCTLPFSSDGAICIDCDSCDAFSTEERRPDFVLLAIGRDTDSLVWVIVEMKRKGDNASSIVQQLESGARKVQAHRSFKVAPPPATLLPLILTERGGVHTADFAVLRKRGIRYLGKSYPIVTKRCGTALDSVLP